MTDEKRDSRIDELYDQVKGLGGPLRSEALVACTTCREGHAGFCPNDLAEEGDVCPVGWLTDEIALRKMESGLDL